VTGAKTGYLHEAEYCLMTRVKAPNGNNVVAVTLGTATKFDSFKENGRLLDYALQNLK
jgi:D-alanyl-D-alanine carboxypeptidase